MIRMLTLLCLLAPGLAPAAGKEEILVSAASSLKDAFTELGRAYESTHEGVRVLFNFASSGQLKAQIENGAPVDVFASADPADMDALAAKSLIRNETRNDFAGNSLVLIAPADSKAHLKEVGDLKSPAVTRIAIGNPDTVPAGRYARDGLLHYQLLDSVKDRLVLAENVRQALDYVSRGEVDAGFVFLTDAMTSSRIRIVARVADGAHKPIVYPIAVTRSSAHADRAENFVSFVSSKASAAVLEKFGFRPKQNG